MTKAIVVPVLGFALVAGVFVEVSTYECAFQRS